MAKKQDKSSYKNEQSVTFIMLWSVKVIKYKNLSSKNTWQWYKKSCQVLLLDIVRILSNLFR